MPLTPADVPSHITTEFNRPLHLVKQGAALPELYSWHAQENPNYPLFTYQDGDRVEFITHAVANRAMDRAARYVLSSLESGGSSVQVSTKPPTVAIFANAGEISFPPPHSRSLADATLCADTITYFSTAVGVLKSGCTVFLISTRNTAAGVADMLKRTSVEQILVSADATIRGVAEEALNQLGGHQVTLREMPVFEDLFSDETRDSAFNADVKLPEKYDPEAFAIILHSSGRLARSTACFTHRTEHLVHDTGSTGHPKPIRWTHKRLAVFGQGPRASFCTLHNLADADATCSVFCEVDSSRSIMGCHGTPMFHGLGAFMYGTAVRMAPCQT